jgi:hypothetical protein
MINRNFYGHSLPAQMMLSGRTNASDLRVTSALFPAGVVGNTGSQTFFLLANASLLLLPMSAPWALSKLTE